MRIKLKGTEKWTQLTAAKMNGIYILDTNLAKQINYKHNKSNKPKNKFIIHISTTKSY